uniref:Uncharacterized protein n=1 Tax=Rhizophora mucronata TaxID=61149 RepID=A0A2P2PAT7_RHIMU
MNSERYSTGTNRKNLVAQNQNADLIG